MTTTKTDSLTRLHLSLTVADLAASVAFYRDLLGVEPDKRHARYARFTLDAPPLVLALVEHAAPRAHGTQRLSHLGMRFASHQAFDDVRQRLIAAGHMLRDEPESRCCYALQHKSWITDPDGNDWEIYRLLEDLDEPGADSEQCCD
jgi:catechol 2,3-dioxygenase-like lactoylglutathione lyase family enzyme